MIGIVVLNYRTPYNSIECVNSIIENTISEYKVYIIDNNSADGSFNYLQNYYKNNTKVCVISSSTNGGYSKGNNLGLLIALEDGADSFAIINSDVVLINNTIDILHNYLFSTNEVGLVGPSIMSNNENKQFARKKLDLKGFVFSKKPFSWISKRCFKDKFRNIDWDKNSKFFVFLGMVSGCCFLIKSDIFKKIGFFDENVFLFHEEDIIAYKLHNLNIKAGIVTDAKILHNESSSVSKKGKAFSRYHRVLSSLYVLKNYARLNNTQMLFSIIISMTPLLLYSLFNVQYRNIFIDLSKQIKLVLFTNHTVE